MKRSKKKRLSDRFAAISRKLNPSRVKFENLPRRIRRAVAHRNMELAGVQHINRQGATKDRERTSLFAMNWRKYIMLKRPKQSQTT